MAMFDRCRHTLEELGKQPGTLALIFGKAQNKFQDPAKLRRVIVDLIDAEDRSAMGADVKGNGRPGARRGTRGLCLTRWQAVLDSNQRP